MYKASQNYIFTLLTLFNSFSFRNDYLDGKRNAILLDLLGGSQRYKVFFISLQKVFANGGKMKTIIFVWCIKCDIYQMYD